MPCLQLRFDAFFGNGFSFMAAQALLPSVSPSHGHIPKAISALPSICDRRRNSFQYSLSSIKSNHSIVWCWAAPSTKRAVLARVAALRAFAIRKRARGNQTYLLFPNAFANCQTDRLIQLRRFERLLQVCDAAEFDSLGPGKFVLRPRHEYDGEHEAAGCQMTPQVHA